MTLEELDLLIENMRQAKEKYKAQEKVASELYSVFQDLENQVLKALDENGKKKYHVDGLGGVTIINELKVKFPRDNESKVKLFEFIKERHGGDVLTSLVSINSNTFNSFFNDEKKKFEVEGVFNVPGLEAPVLRKRLSFRKES